MYLRIHCRSLSIRRGQARCHPTDEEAGQRGHLLGIEQMSLI